MTDRVGPMSLPVTLALVLKRAQKVLRDPDSAQDFVLELWQEIQRNKPIRHFNGYVRLRLRKALHRNYQSAEVNKRCSLLCELMAEDDSDSDDVLDRLHASGDEDEAYRAELEKLSAYERDLVGLLSAGFSAPEIADLQDVYPRTIYNAIHAIKDRKVTDRSGPARYVPRSGPMTTSAAPVLRNRCVYVYVTPCGTPYYVGKGTIRRVYSRSHSVSLPRDPKDIRILAKNLTDADARQAEMLFIRMYGRRDLGTGTLLNHTDGADGAAYNVKLSLGKDADFYERNPGFCLIQHPDGYWYSPEFPDQPPAKQQVLKFPAPIDPVYVRKMAERAELDRLRSAWERAAAENSPDRYNAYNDYNALRCKLAA